MFSQILTTILLVTWSSKVTEAALGFSASSNNMVLSSDYQAEIPTELVFKFDFVNALVNTKKITIKTKPTNGELFESTGTTCVTTLDSTGATLSTTNAISCATGTGGSGDKIDSLVCTVQTGGITNAAHTITCKGGIKPNKKSYFNWKFDMAHDDATTGIETTTDEEGWKVGLPRIYYRRSECRAGGLPMGAEQVVANDDLAGDYAKECTAATGTAYTIGFVVTTGIQLKGGDTGTCFDGKRNKYRCDTMYFTDSSMDVAVSTYGNFGTLACGAYTKGASSAPDYSIMNDVSTNLQAANSIEVDEADRYADQVISLTGLPIDVQLDIYCHMSERVLSPMLRAWTDENDRIWGDSLVPAVITASTPPVALKLTFYHGKDMTAGGNDVISLTAVKGGSTTIITSNTPACTATSTPPGSNTAVDISITVARADSATGTGVTVVADGTTNALTSFTLNNAVQTSTAGSKIEIVCNSNLVNNPASGTIVYDLHVEGHPTIRSSRFGYTVA